MQFSRNIDTAHVIVQIIKKIYLVVLDKIVWLSRYPIKFAYCALSFASKYKY